MAVAEQIQRIEIKMVEQEIPHEEYVLTLSKEEAQFVINYLGHTVTGSRDSPRKHADAVYSALRLAGLDYSMDFPNIIERGVHHNHFKGIQGGY